MWKKSRCWPRGLTLSKWMCRVPPLRAPLPQLSVMPAVRYRPISSPNLQRPKVVPGMGPPEAPSPSQAPGGPPQQPMRMRMQPGEFDSMLLRSQNSLKDLFADELDPLWNGDSSWLPDEAPPSPPDRWGGPRQPPEVSVAGGQLRGAWKGEGIKPAVDPYAAGPTDRRVPPAGLTRPQTEAQRRAEAAEAERLQSRRAIAEAAAPRLVTPRDRRQGPAPPGGAAQAPGQMRGWAQTQEGLAREARAGGSPPADLPVQRPDFTPEIQRLAESGSGSESVEGPTEVNERVGELMRPQRERSGPRGLRNRPLRGSPGPGPDPASSAAAQGAGGGSQERESPEDPPPVPPRPFMAEKVPQGPQAQLLAKVAGVSQLAHDIREAREAREATASDQGRPAGGPGPSGRRGAHPPTKRT
eukprot:jgi/Botrbrau1/16850/Bobra.150_2s0072.1